MARAILLRYLLGAIAFAATGCGPSARQREAYAELVGVWHVYALDAATGREYDRSLVGLAQLPNGRLKATHLDLRPSGLVRIGESDITHDDGVVQYEAPDWGGGVSSFVGRINEARDTIQELTDGRYRQLWRRTTAPEATQIIRHVDSILASPARAAYAYRRPPETGDGWATADLADAGIETELIVELVRGILDGRYNDIHSLLIARDGRLVLEEYFRADGALHSPLLTARYRIQPHHLASTTKSVTALLVGLAIDQGMVGGVEVPALTFFPQHADLNTERRREILVRHLLTMTAGLEWDDDHDVPGMWSGDDVVRYYLAKPVVAHPGSTFVYANGSTTTLGAIVASASGMRLDAFAERFLFAPLGITAYSWQVYPDSTTDADGGLALRPRDLAKLGHLVLREGEWNGDQVVSANWVREATAKRLRRSDERWYGYSWWQTDFSVHGSIVESIHSWGWGGQYVFVFPTLGLVVVSTGGNFDYESERHLFRMIETHILPAVVGETESGGSTVRMGFRSRTNLLPTGAMGGAR